MAINCRIDSQELKKANLCLQGLGTTSAGALCSLPLQFLTAITPILPAVSGFAALFINMKSSFEGARLQEINSSKGLAHTLLRHTIIDNGYSIFKDNQPNFTINTFGIFSQLTKIGQLKIDDIYAKAQKIQSQSQNNAPNNELLALAQAIKQVIKPLQRYRAIVTALTASIVGASIGALAGGVGAPMGALIGASVGIAQLTYINQTTQEGFETIDKFVETLTNTVDSIPHPLLTTTTPKKARAKRSQQESLIEKPILPLTQLAHDSYSLQQYMTNNVSSLIPNYTNNPWRDIGE